MITCPQCQHNNPQEANFCNSCGFSLKDLCPQCGAPIPAGSNFCQACGSAMDTPGIGTKPTSGKKDVCAKKEAERRQLTILFSDMVGSTPLSEQLDPEEYRQLIMDYHQIAKGVIEQNGGHVAQYLGDGLLVYFGYPEGLEDAPREGIRAGLGIIKAIKTANEQWFEEGRTQVKLRIGIHTGLVVVDEHLALGETVNIAARLEGEAPQDGIVISAQTQRLTEGWFDTIALGRRELKGITQPMEVFQVLGESGLKTRLEIAKSRGLSPLVGRDKELETLFSNWTKAKNGSGQLVLLKGEAGIGKSRLVDSMKQKLERDKAGCIYEARCSAYHQNSAFFPVIELVEKTVLHLKSEDSTEAKLEIVEGFTKSFGQDHSLSTSILAEFLSVSTERYPPVVMSPIAKRQILLDLLCDVMGHLSKKHPILFILEDLHWADASTIEWFGKFLTQLPDQGIFALCTARPEFIVGWDPQIQHVQIDLRRLTGDQLSDICFHHTEGKTLPREILDQIAQKTEGVPLFVEELMKMMLESEILVEEPASYKLSGDLNTISIPSTLQDSLIARLDRLSDVKEIVQVGAVIGREFSYEMLHAIMEWESDFLDRSMNKLLMADILIQRSNGQHPIYLFKHALIQDAAYQSLLKTKRQELHYRVAEIVKSQFGQFRHTRPEVLAHHYTEAGQPLTAIPIWLQAGQLANQKNANTEAIAHLERGIGLLHHVKSEDERIGLELDFRLTLGGVYVVAFGFPHPKVKETFDLARELAQSTEISPKLALILFNLLSYYMNTEDYESNEELTEYIMKLVEDPVHGYWFRLVGTHLGGSGILKGEFEQASRGFREVLEIFNPDLPFPWELAPSGNLEIGTKAWWMICLQILGHLDQAKELADQHLSYAENHEDSMTLYHIYTFPSLYSLNAREWSLAEKIIEDYFPIVRDFGDPIFILTAEVYYHIARAFQGKEGSLEKADQLVNVCFEVGFKAFASTMQPWICELYYQCGDYKSSLAWVERAMDHVNYSGTHLGTAELWRVKGLNLQAIGKTEHAEDCYQKALDLSRKQSAKTFELRASCAMANLWVEQGHKKKAREIVKRVYDWFDGGFDSVDLREAQSFLE